MKPIIKYAREYFTRRFTSIGSTSAETRFAEVLTAANLAQLLRFKGLTDDASVDAFALAQCKAVFPTQHDRDGFLREWKIARDTLANTYKEEMIVTKKGRIAEVGIYCFTWWRKHQLKFPACNSVVSRLALLQPSSAACERVFSLYKNVNGDDNPARLMDIKRASVMVPYNHRMRQTPVVCVKL